MSQKKKLAIFDIDGTIFRSSLLIELLHGLVEKKIFPSRVLREIREDHLAWLDRKGGYETYIRRVVDVYLKYHRDVFERDIKQAVRHVLHEHKARTYRYTRDLISTLKKKNYLLVAISGSPDYIVQGFARHLGFAFAFGPTSEVKNGRFTGRRWDGNKFSFKYDIPRKDRTLQSFIRSKGLTVDWKSSIAVGDTESDIPMLKSVGKPIAFNPNSILATWARKNGCTIVVERKDVVYEIQKGKFLRLGT